MQRLNGALRFIDLNFRMAQNQEALQKPWMYLTLGGGILTLLWLLPLGVLIRWLGSWPLVWVVVGVMILLYVWCLLVLGEITALLTAQIFAGLINEDEGTSTDVAPRAVFSAHWLDILLYVLAVPGLTLILAVEELLSGTSQPTPNWKKAHPLIPPIIALENLDMTGAVQAVRAVVDENLLRFQPGYLPVGLVARGVEWISILFGFSAGASIAARIADPLFSASWRSVVAVGGGLAMAGVFVLAGIAFSTFFRTCYHTALYTWVCKVQTARKGTGDPMASPPDIITQAMSKKPSNGPNIKPENEKEEENNATKT